jgi:hypothetical protein
MAVRVWAIGSISAALAVLGACSGKAGPKSDGTGATSGDSGTGSTASLGGEGSASPGRNPLPSGGAPAEPSEPGSGGKLSAGGGTVLEPDAGGAGGAAPNREPGIVVTFGSRALHESYGTLQFRVALTSPPSASVTVELSSSDVTHATLFPTSVTFTPENWAMPQSAVIVGVADVVADGAHLVTITTEPAVSEDPSYDGLDADDLEISVLDDTDAGITVGAQHGVTSESGTTATFNIVLNSQPTASVTIPFSSSDTSEASVVDAVTFVPSEWNLPHTVSVTGVDDELEDGDQPYDIVPGAAVSEDPSYDGLVPASVHFSNLDDE